jgi:CRISPR-associated protein Cas1
MATLYLSEQGSTLRREQNRIIVERDDVRLAELHEFKLERVVIFGNIQLTTPVIGFLLDRGIETTFLSLHGKLKGRLAPLATRNAILRVRQYQRLGDTGFSTNIIRSFIAGKIRNSMAVLSRHQRNHPQNELGAAIERISTLLPRIGQFDQPDSLRGVEGQAAAIYFENFGHMLRRGWSFKKRERRPPPDPVNALLSLGYTLLYNEAIGTLSAVGCDPYPGFLHTPGFGRCSLALDLMEEFRPLFTDRLVLSLLNLGSLSTHHFEKSDDGGVLLTSDGRKIFFREYERLVTSEFLHTRTQDRTTLRRALFDQAHALRRSIMRKIPYTPFNGWR